MLSNECKRDLEDLFFMDDAPPDHHNNCGFGRDGIRDSAKKEP